MGNNSCCFGGGLNEKLKEEKITFGEKEETDLNNLSFKCFRQGVLIDKNYFKHILQVSDKNILNAVLNMFPGVMNNNSKIAYKNLKNFYLCLNANDPKIKILFISYLLFNSKRSLNYSVINNNIFNLFSRDLILQYNLSLIVFQIIEKLKSNKKIEEKYYLKYFYQLMEENINLFENYIFIKNIIGASKYELKLNKEEELNYICDCNKFSDEKKKKSNLDSLEKGLEQISVKDKGFVPFEEFHKFLENVKTHNNIINLLIDYLKKYTQKDYCIPEDIINIFKNLDYFLSLKDKKIFLFKMILKIYGQEKNLDYAQINKYLNIEYKNNKIIVNDNSQLYDEKGFLNNDIFEEMINNLNPYLESFGLIPYKYLKVKVNAKEKIKIIIN